MAIDPEFFKRFADVLAEEVQRELVDRKILLLTSDEKIKAFHHVGRNVSQEPHIYQASVLVEWPRDARNIDAREFLYKYVRRWGIEMGIKLARPEILTTYEMELPRGVEAAAVGRTDGLVLRCVVNYSIQDDLLALRIDTLAKWDD